MKIVKTRRASMLSAAVTLLACATWQSALPPAADAGPLQGGVSDSQTIQGPGGSYDYPAPVSVQMQPPPVQLHVNQDNQRMVPQQPRMAPQPPPRPPMQLRTQTTVALPQGYLGVWHVAGRRKNVDAQPEFQAAAQQAFSPATDNTWQITGSPGSYSMGNGQMSTQLWVDRVGPDGTAFIRYQHQVGKTMAQEAIVMSLAPGGAQFSGLERISIVKDGGPPRAKVTYELMGQRQR
jgi:hypothetical protein